MSVLEDFFAAPSESLLVALTKEQLVNVADFYGTGNFILNWHCQKQQRKIN